MLIILLLGGGRFNNNVIIFWFDNSFHADNKQKDIFVFGKNPGDRLDNTAITAEGITKNVCLNLHWNGSNRFLFVNGAKVYQLKVKYSETDGYQLCLDNISQDFIFDRMKKTGLYECVNNVSV